MRIIFVNQPLTAYERYGQLAIAGSYSPPMALCSLAAVARRAGHHVSILDAQALGLDHEKTLCSLHDMEPELVAMTSFTPTFISGAKLARMIKERFPSSPVVVMGGPHITALPEKSLEECSAIDIGAIGEGEETFIELLDCLSLREFPLAVPGIILRHGGKCVINPRRELIKNLDSLPFPAWDLLAGFPKGYSTQLTPISPGSSVSITTSRGCLKRCVFCDRSVFGNKVRANSAEYMLEMVKYLNKNYGVRCFMFEDDNFLVLKKRLAYFCELLLNEGIRIIWACQASTDMISAEILPLMRKAGCRMIMFGIESGSQRILDLMGKGVRVEQMEEAIKLTRGSGILTRGLMIAGFFGETKETLDQTFAFLQRSELDDISWHYFTPFPGSEAWSRVKEHGSFKPQWDKMNFYHPAFVPNGLRAEELTSFVKKSYRRFYFRPRVILSYLKHCGSPHQLFKLLRSAFALLTYSLKLKER